MFDELKFTNTHAISLTEFIQRIYEKAALQAEEQERAEEYGGGGGGDYGGGYGHGHGRGADAGFEYNDEYNAGGLPQQAEQADDDRTVAAAAAVVRGGLGLEDKAAEGEEWAAAMSPGAGN